MTNPIKKIVSFGAVLVLGALLASLGGNWQKIEASMSKSIVWQTSSDWTGWSFDKVVWDGSGAHPGLRADINPSGGYYTSGSISYKYSPGVVADWSSANYKISNTLPEQTGIDFHYSTSPISASNPGSSDPGALADSKDLYIKADFTALATSTPILEALTLYYAPQSDILVNKKFYLQDETDPTKLTDKTDRPTFEVADKIVVQIEINLNGASSLSLVVRDYRLLVGVGGSITKITKREECGLKSSDQILNPTFNANKDGQYSEWSGVMPSSQFSYLCYRYQITTGELIPKNKLVQARTVLLTGSDAEAGLAAVSDSYLVVLGSIYNNSTDQTAISYGVFPIEDILLFSKMAMSYNDDKGKTRSLPSVLNYFYQKGQGAKSRGGELLSLPVKLKDVSGEKVLSASTYYLFFNPAFYLFGNIYSKIGGVGRKLDMGSRATSIHTGETLTAENAQEDLNSKAALFGYKLDENSVQFWNPANRDKNTKMDAIISKLIGPPSDPVVCPLKNVSEITGDKSLYLSNPDCQITQSAQSAQNAYPDGRIWYLSADVVGASDIKIKGNMIGKGTIIIDYGQAGAKVPTVKISTSVSDFDNSQMSPLGLILINGGQVEFGSDCAMYKGIVFVPGDKNNADSGSIIFAEGTEVKKAQRMKIFGSIVADKIVFAGRNDGSGIYSVAIYSDSAILNAPPPGFRDVQNIVLGK